MKKAYLLIGIVIIAALLRFIFLGSNPPSLTWDETAWGYNAYTLGIDGKDEFGVFLPYKYLESFGDFKPPAYAYLDILPVKIFGLNEFAVRFPSALFGTLTVLLTYFLTLQIFHTSKEKKQYALFSSLFLAISPWHINLSRAAFEANVATFFLVAGVMFFLYAINKRSWFLVLSAFFFVLSMYTFNTSRIVAPLLVLMLGVSFYRKLLILKKETIISIAVGVILILPIAGFLMSPQASLRFKEVNIFSNPEEVVRANQEILNDNNALWSKIIHNRRAQYAVSFLNHYFDNLDPSFLFIKGDGNPKFSSQDVGQLYLWSLPFILVGSLFLFRKREGHWYLVPIWLLLGIIPAATARETPHALRIETVLPTFQIIEAYGLVVALCWMKNIKLIILKVKIWKLFYVVCFTFYILSVFYYLYGYYVHYARVYSGEWQYGYKESVAYVTSVEKDYEEIYVTTVLGRPYIYYLFYQQRNPDFLRENSVINRDAFGFIKVQQMGKYRFVDDPGSIKGKGRVLYVDNTLNPSGGAKILKKIKLLNGRDTLFIYTK